MQIGAHVSISGSIDNAVDNAVVRKCTAFQIFTRNPRSWHAKDLTEDEIKNFSQLGVKLPMENRSFHFSLYIVVCYLSPSLESLPFETCLMH